MEKILSAGIAVLLIISLFFSGCQKVNQIAIENHNWLFSHIQSGTDGSISACSKDKAQIYDSAKIMDLQLEAKDGVLNILNNDTAESYELTYTVNTAKANDIIYDIASADKRGLASVGITEYHESKSEYTLIISIDGYALHFFETIQ